MIAGVDWGAQLAVLAAIGLFGALGAVLRFWVSAAVARAAGGRFPWETFAVNLSGALAIGMLAGLFAAGPAWGGAGAVWLVLAIGLLGSYTTVSSFSLQVLALVRAGGGRVAAAYVLASLAACLGAAAACYAGVSALAGS